MNKDNMYKEMAIGFVIALIATSFGSYIFIEFFSNYDFEKSLALIKEGNLQGKVLVIGALANLFVFFMFIKKNQIYRARGVLLETILIALFVTVLTLFF
ncbi:hypothetical protein R3X25_10270 [Lutibacter sp. TH_r2]|uniref:hypothetical protein n=1 Tax=Lutibacter sp. TH_r2 TaxID=3082083 RepID=UPI002954BEEF|nr:hypothetical protein [Lutibacter sp. TH_r2]MDV7187666.1 hypothetical protein [Lutibacter sp. TH_r2]